MRLSQDSGVARSESGNTISGMASSDSVHIPLADEQEFGSSDWEKATAQVLRKMRRLDESASDADVWQALAHTTLDGLAITPLGTPALTSDLRGTGVVGGAPFTRGARADGGIDGTGAWDIRGWFTDPDVDQTAADVVTDLENGVNSLWITVGAGGVPSSALAKILEPVFLDLAPVVVSGDDQLAAAQALVDVIKDKAIEPHPATSLGVADLTLTGASIALAKSAGVGRAFTVDATAIHDRGASNVQELAYSLKVGADYLRAAAAAGIDVAEAAALVEFRYAATDEQFPTIAKLRAARRLWNRVLELSGVTAATGQSQHVVTSRPMMSKYDPYVNMLRTMVAAFAAGAGGAQAVTVLPFDEPLGLPIAFSRRIARNISSLLIAESHVAAVADPGGGSHLIESLTDDMARAAWELFGALDDSANLGADLDALVAATVTERAQKIATRALPLTGVTEFPNLGEELPARKPYAIAPDVLRYGSDFEALRDAPADKPVFLATMGTVAQHTARATFISNLFAAGGIAVDVAGATADVASLIEQHGGQAVVCLAGTDAAYDAWGAEAAAALRANGATRVIVAGKPRDWADDSAAMGVDALAFLARTREALA